MQRQSWRRAIPIIIACTSVGVGAGVVTRNLLLLGISIVAFTTSAVLRIVLSAPTAESAQTAVSIDDSLAPAPTGTEERSLSLAFPLRDLRHQLIWRSIESSRQRLQEILAASYEREKRRRASQLAFTDERILALGRKSILRYWPYLVMSATLLGVSITLPSDPRSMIAILSSALCLAAARVRSLSHQYILTDRRVLVGRRKMLRSDTEWKTAPYEEIHSIAESTTGVLHTINVHGSTPLKLVGLRHAKLDEFLGILHAQR